MFMNNFKWDEKPPVFDVPDGEHKVKIVKVFDANTQSGKPYTGFLLCVEGGSTGYTHSIYYGNEYTNRNWTSFLMAFGIQPPPTTDDWANYYAMWEGLEGRAMFHHKEDTFTDRQGVQRTINKCELHYFLSKQQAAKPRTTTPTQPAQPSQPAQQVAKSLKNSGEFPEDIPFELY